MNKNKKIYLFVVIVLANFVLLANLKYKYKEKGNSGICDLIISNTDKLNYYNSSGNKLFVESDIPNGYVGNNYYEDFCEKEYAITNTGLTIKTTCEGLSNHGPGRELGYNSTFLSNGCNCYRRSGYSYGSNYLPYYINTEGFTTNEINEIERQANLWNQAIMHDGTGQIVNLYRVYNTDNISGRPVLQIYRINDDGGGLFTPTLSSPKIEIFNSANNDTPLHEFGHYLGLRDTDKVDNVSYGTHKTIMGYDRYNYDIKSIDTAIQYQDIQGIAIANSSHTHSFTRYAVSDSKRVYICFYCDAYTVPTTTNISNSYELVNSNNCIHNYEKIVSHGNRYWLKCINCYKVVESEFDIECENQNGLYTLKIIGLLDKNVTSIAIPSEIGGQSVTSIGSEAFKDCKSLLNVYISSSVRNVDIGAFEGCTNLRSVVLSNELTSIGNSVFKGCTSLNMIDIPNSVRYIDPNAFENCTSLQRVYFFDRLISIGTSAFKGCTSLDRLSIPNSVTNIDSNAFENCISLESVTLSNSLTSIGTSVFKDCHKLTSITIPNTVTNFDPNAFENCTSLESVTLPNSLISIGTSVFKGCTSLKEITIPNSVTNIDSNAFEGCTRLKEVILSNTLHAIGTQAFKDCTRLSSIIFPSSVQYIDDEAFKNCSALSLVTVNREISDITNLGENVFEGTRANLQIVVPTNRIAEYKNKVYWSSYRNKITPSGQYSELTLNCESNLSNIVNLNQSYNKLYKLNANCSKAYKFNVTSTIDVNIIVYDINMNVLSNSCNIATPFLSCGTYYISLEFVDPNGAGNFEMLTSLRWTSADIQLLSGANEIKNSMHLNNENVYHCKYYYNNNQGAGFYKISLNTGSNIAYPDGTMKIYSDPSRTTILNRYGTTGINKQAITDSNENEIYLYLPEGRSYIDIVLPLTTYSSISLTIEQVESNNLNYLNTLSSTCLDEIFANKTLPIYFEEVIISHRSTIQLDIMTNGTITDNIPVYIMSKEKENGYDIGVEIYRLKLKLRDYITKSDRGPVFTTILDPGTYYIGYIGNNNNVSINLVIKRLVNQDLNINGTLVADPANDLGFIAGSEVTLNGGSFRGNTITEGFTRHLYLMVENVLEEPISRLEYDWYSSNENVAKVTAYGTVLAMNVNADTDVTIYAVQKDEPSRVYRTTFTIKKETETDPILISCEMSYSYAQENGNYTLELDFSNSPYPMIQYYNWSIDVPNQENNISVSMNYFGVITSSGIGYVVLTGVYTINPRVTITINLTITE